MKLNSKESVALSSVVASIILTIMKFVVGARTGSMGILSEAAHSLLDFGAALLTFFAVRVGDKPPDTRHPYGHGKVESISALVETGLLFLTSIWIIYEAIQRLLFKSVEVEATWYAFAVVIISILIDYSRSKALSKVAKLTGSQALEADALHFSSDILSSGVVFIGLVFVALGTTGADAIAAIGVALFVTSAGFKLGRRTIDVLVDTAPHGLSENIAHIAQSVDGVLGIEKIRVRPAGIAIFIDMELVISRQSPFEKVRQIIKTVEENIKKKYPEADTTISAKPIALDSELITERIHIIAANHNLPIHDIVVRDKGTSKNISFDLEVNNKLSLSEAHKIASHLETEIKKELGVDIMIDTHIEPTSLHPVKSGEVSLSTRRKITQIFRGLKQNTPQVKDIHDIKIERTGDKLFVTIHCIFEDKTPIETVHAIASRLEYLAKRKIPTLQRVVVHPEPIVS